MHFAWYSVPPLFWRQARQQQAINERFGIEPDKWTSETGSKYTTYTRKLTTPIKVYETVFTEIRISEYEKSGKVDDQTKYVGFFCCCDSKVAADVEGDKLGQNIVRDGFKHDNTFMQMWLSKSGEFSVGANAYKTYKGRLGLVFRSTLTWGEKCSNHNQSGCDPLNKQHIRSFQPVSFMLPGFTICSI